MNYALNKLSTMKCPKSDKVWSQTKKYFFDLYYTIFWKGAGCHFIENYCQIYILNMSFYHFMAKVHTFRIKAKSFKKDRLPGVKMLLEKIRVRLSNTARSLNFNFFYGGVVRRFKRENWKNAMLASTCFHKRLFSSFSIKNLTEVQTWILFKQICANIFLTF